MAHTAHRTPNARAPRQTAGPPAAGRNDPAGTRAAIVAGTVRLIGRGGTALVTHRAVAAEAGVSLSSTTYHFASKDAIVDAALRSVAEREVERLAAAAAQLRDRGDVPEVVDATLDWLAAQLAEDDELVRAGYHLQLETARRPQLAAAHLAWARAVQRLAEEVLRAAGSPSPGLDARLLAAAIDGLRLEQLTLPGHAGGVAGRVASARPVVERLLRLLTGTGGEPSGP